MKNKKIFNNLPESIFSTVLLVFILVFFVVAFYFSVFHPQEGTDPAAAAIILSILSGSVTITLIVLIIIGCYSYWILTDEVIISKKLLRKKVTIKLDEIEKVEIKEVSNFILWSYSSDAYIIYSKGKKIIVLIPYKRCKIKDLETELENRKFI